MNVAVVQVGSYLFGFNRASDATKAVELLSRAIPLESEWDSENKQLQYEVIEPGSGRDRNNLSMTFVGASQIRRPIKRAPKSRQLGFTQPIG